MKYALKVALACTAVTMVAGVAFAQGGGNGNGGSGGGSAHGAATSGMTRNGDPVSSPLDAIPGKNDFGKNESDTHSMPPNDALNTAKSGQ
ncbi:hypothetical protein VSR82_23595 [Burkholderia sp. JPY481]|uniref:hypothetical protein n=1 Tax=unclassified Paraburkholderia TaxID=2615204 RepID=UPI003171A4C7